MTTFKTAAAALGLLALLPTAQATLQGRDADGNAANGYEAYYDTVLNITWLADANHAYTSGMAAATRGSMDWQTTQAWIANTVNAGTGLYGVTDWRLPTTPLVDPSQGFTWSGSAAQYYQGLTDYSINRADPSTELGYMFYVNLGLKAWADSAGVERAAGTYGVEGTPGLQRSKPVRGGFYNAVMLVDLQTPDGLSFQHVSTDALWSGTNFTNDPNVGPGRWAVVLYTYDGQIDTWEAMNTRFTNEAAAWLVSNGDKFAAPPVPEPTTWALLLGGLAALGWRRRAAR